MIGERVNNYEIRSILGEGGMGAVYLAEHPFMGRKAAIKVLRRELAEDRGLVERFMNEARAANAIHHPNIIDIIDVGLLPSGIPYLMMEFLDGETLAQANRAPAPAAGRRCGRRRHADRLGAPGGARQGDRSPRSQARQPVPGARRRARRSAQR